MGLTIGIVIDVVIVALLVILGLIGLKKGFFKSILSIFSFAVCLLVAIFTAKFVAGWINGIYDFSNLIGSKITKSLESSNSFFAQSINTYETLGKDSLLSAIPADTNGAFKQIIKAIFSGSNVDLSSTNSIGYIVGSTLGDIAMVIITGIFIFIILKVFLAIIIKILDGIISKITIIGGLNKLLGLIFGVLKGALIVVGINIVLVGLSLVPGINKTFPKFIENNTVVEKVVYKTTDNLFGKHVIEGDYLQNTVEKLWKNK